MSLGSYESTLYFELNFLSSCWQESLCCHLGLQGENTGLEGERIKGAGSPAAGVDMLNVFKRLIGY